MKHFVYIVFAAIFFGMAVFGAFVLSHGMEHGGICFIMTAGGAPCPEADIAGFISRHFDALRVFGTAVFALSLAVAFIAFLVYVIGALAPNVPFLLFVVRRSLFTFHFPLFTRVLRWISRFEHSPSVIIFRG